MNDAEQIAAADKLMAALENGRKKLSERITSDDISQEVVEAVATAVHGALSKCDVMNYLNMPDDTAEKVAQAAIAATFAFIREQADSYDAVMAGMKSADADPLNARATFLAMLDQIERTQNDG